MTTNHPDPNPPPAEPAPSLRPVEEIAANFRAAHDWISDICTGERSWRMRVPADQRHAFDGRSDHHHAASVAALGAIAPYRHVCTEECFETFMICAHDGQGWPCPTAAALAEGASR